MRNLNRGANGGALTGCKACYAVVRGRVQGIEPKVALTAEVKVEGVCGSPFW